MSEEAETNSSSSGEEENVKSQSLDNKEDVKPSSSSSSLGPSIFVQPMKSKDASAIAEIWADGVLQIVETVPFYFKGLVLHEAQKIRDDALTYDGDVGPQGKSPPKKNQEVFYNDSFPSLKKNHVILY